MPGPDAQPGSCPTCRGQIRPGDMLYCPDCHASGFEATLAAQREIVGAPPEEPRPHRASQRTLKKVSSVAGQVSKKAARAALKGGVGR